MTGPERLQKARLYVVTPDRGDELLDLARAALRGGADILQLRHKTVPRGELLALARRLREATTNAGAVFIVNDHVDIALIAGADGVHLGPNDMSIEAARRIAPEGFVIGASAQSVEAARAAVRAGADYIGSGPAFSTPVKQEKAVIGPAGIAAVTAAVDVPVFAIGGIDESNLSQLTALGIHRACVIRSVSDAPDPEQATARLHAIPTA